ncbi:YkgJ family cysteine cluster protein [Geomobilimonas luticola]|uniref:YkgJ family cysteine cluster protein n=1 Tax=Geomobilimonas luticola TaxID=1114878 RepID=A0ABS5SCX1_9BACT|nr:YkgJ family cysteine cluster protein [Geomobilimonas luticola]MBT0653228.1 YkgJ family cysteine cluster protein [Geomobilimonas luticola]
MGVDQTAFSAAAQQAIGEKLAKAVDAAGLRVMLETAAHATEQALDEGRNREQAALIACHAGCSACCNLNVAALLPEAISIAAWLRERENHPDFTPLAAKVEKFARYLRWVDDEERIRLRLPCAFLDHRGWCLIHPLRPLMCRSIAATDPEQCRKSLDITWLDDEEPVMLNLEQKFLYDEAFMHVATALDRHGLDSRSMELHTAVQAFMECPERVDEFFNGARIRL